MSPKRAASGGLFLLAVLVWAWLLTLWTHELGHVIGAVLTGSTVQQVVLHPFAFSRTDVHPNHNPLLVVWAGPVGGCLFGALVSLLFAVVRKRTVTAAMLSGGFCWLVNGIYIGIGTVAPVADAQAMIDSGSPPWALGIFGLSAGVPGYWMIRRGFGRFRKQAQENQPLVLDTLIVGGCTAVLVGAGLVCFPGP